MLDENHRYKNNSHQQEESFQDVSAGRRHPANVSIATLSPIIHSSYKLCTPLSIEHGRKPNVMSHRPLSSQRTAEYNAMSMAPMSAESLADLIERTSDCSVALYCAENNMISASVDQCNLFTGEASPWLYFCTTCTMSTTRVRLTLVTLTLQGFLKQTLLSQNLKLLFVYLLCPFKRGIATRSLLLLSISFTSTTKKPSVSSWKSFILLLILVDYPI